MIGANGAGKSNLIGVFRLLNEIVNRQLQLYVGRSGGVERFLHRGRKVTESLELNLEFGHSAYHCSLISTADDSLVFRFERASHREPSWFTPLDESLGSGHKETKLNQDSSPGLPVKAVLSALEGWRIYHFHDTSESSKIKQVGDLADNTHLRSDAGNLAAFLYRLQETEDACFQNIIDTIRMVAPFFGDFVLQPDRLNPRKIRLEWHEQGSDAYFDAHSLSDGTLRFISLATLLLQPELPTTVLLDEPELGLHPYAITLLAELLRSASQRAQILVSTQSVTLVNQLSPEDVIVVDRVEGESRFRRLEESEIASWLENYSLGELWEKNLLGGRPAL
ncbi:MAG: AAA family ATPase [Thermoanaerobaculia bacterium]|nr:AAA family ATPase [Thermoanaerobaculia bacterium]